LCRVEGDGRRGLDGHQHLRGGVLDRLEGADRSAELVALLAVIDGKLEHSLSGAQRVGGDENSRSGGHFVKHSGDVEI
jgi:hypothetical protein